MIEKKDTITRMGKYALAICILHLLGPVWNGRCVFQIDFLELVRTNFIGNIAVSFLIIYSLFIKKNSQKKANQYFYMIEVLLLAWTINFQFMFFNEGFLFLLNPLEEQKKSLINRNIQECYQNKEKEENKKDSYKI